MAREDHWTYKLFVENAEMCLPALKEPEGEAEGQVDALVELFDRQGLLEGGRVLDTACGIGRHSIRLARLGYQVTGVDLSPLYVRKAEESATEEGHDARFLHGDIMKIESLLQDAPPFDAVLVVLTINRDWVMRVFSEKLATDMGPYRVEMHQRFNFETSTMHNAWDFYEDESEKVKLSVAVETRLCSLHELKDLLEEAGWKYRQGLGSIRGDEIDLEDLTLDHNNMWVVARAS